MMQLKDITIILLLYNTPIKTLNNLKNYKKFKIIILDQSNDFETKKSIKKILPNILYYKITKKNKGFAKAINFLSQKVKTKFFLCTQPDVNINLRSILNLKKVFHKKTNCIIAVPKIKNFKNYDSKKNNKKIVPVDKMIGAVFLANKKLFDDVNKFDENFFFYWEDIDLSKRIKSSKYQIYLNKDSVANHIGGKSTDQNLKTLFIKESNFKFGEYLYQYKNSNLRFIKIIREPIIYIFYILIYLITFQIKKLHKKFSKFFGILKFFTYLILCKKLK
tara:strand:- start:595 stop:1422 length:828 start_codon:yes stop_codon:yes gene_type:complete